MEKPTLREALTQLLNGEVEFVRLPEVLNYTEISVGRLDTCRVIIADPIPQTEEVEVVRWYCIETGTIYPGHIMNNYDPDKPSKFVKLTGTYTREKKLQVKRTEVLGEMGDHTIKFSGHVAIPSGAKVIAEWTEDAP